MSREDILGKLGQKCGPRQRSQMIVSPRMRSDLVALVVSILDTLGVGRAVDTPVYKPVSEKTRVRTVALTVVAVDEECSG
jgi:hypothetical protein